MSCDDSLVKEDDDDDEGDSSDDMKLVIQCSVKKSKVQLSLSEKVFIEGVEDEVERSFEEKAAKTNLNATNVKSIIKHVLMNEDVRTLVEHAEKEEDVELVYEPKLTRAKAKELMSKSPSTTCPVPPVRWPVTKKKKKSAVEVLMSKDLQEDSSGDDYNPEEDMSDQESSVADTLSLPPPTPPTPVHSESGTQTNWTEDGVFKIPECKTKEEEEAAAATIALRTRSKLSLSSTPLEEIEEAFIPPDITTDMYDMDCDNDDWMDFLKKFTRPLDEVAKPSEDEELDPEYNILADEEFNNVDKEELRADKAVEISKKELNQLIAELFDCTCENMESTRLENSYGNANVSLDDSCIEEFQENEQDDTINDEDEEDETSMPQFFEPNQIPLLEQQLRQHIQMLTQNFILTYEHPELHEHSLILKEYLMNFKFLSKGNSASVFNTHNLKGALELVEKWEWLLLTNNEEVKKMKEHIIDTLSESMRHMEMKSTYIYTFPKLILETISRSEVFMYPSLLPEIPFRAPKLFAKTKPKFHKSEDQLIAMALEQLTKDCVSKNDVNKFGEVKLEAIGWHVCRHMLTYQQPYRIKARISQAKYLNAPGDPICYYYLNQKAPTVVHYLTPLEPVLPPCQRLSTELPYQWRTFLFPTGKTVVLSPATPQQPRATPLVVSAAYPVRVVCSGTSALYGSEPPALVPIQRTPIRKKLFHPRPVRKRGSPPVKRTETNRVLRSAKEKTPSVKPKSDPLSNFVRCLRDVTNRLIVLEEETNDDILESVNIQKENMLPNMPTLNSPLKRSSEEEKKVVKVPLDFSIISSANFQRENQNTEVEIFKKSSDYTDNPNIDIKLNITNKNGQEGTFKDNMEDINNLMKASSKLKPSARKEPSGAEKKKAKLRREFLGNLSITAPEDPEEEKKKNEMFALQYYDKMRETLDLDDYHKIMQLLNEYEENDAVELYKQMEKILRPKYEQLAEEFLFFLREREAAQVNRLVPWIRLNNRTKFLRKLETYFKDQPLQLKKIYKCLAEFSQNKNATMEQIKTTLLPMFKGNSVLNDLFLQNFLDEHPPPSLLEGPPETIDLNKELARLDNEEAYETITIPDSEDKYGSQNCICNCHKIEDPEFKLRSRHCIRCGTKFLNGKAYIQSGKGLRPASISFLTNPDVDHNVRLNGKVDPVCHTKKRGFILPSKENVEEDTDDETDGKKKPKKKISTRQKSEGAKKDIKDSPKSKAVGKNETTPKLKCRDRKRADSPRKITKEKENKPAEDEKGESTSKPGSNPGQEKRFLEDSIEPEDNNVTSCDAKPNSPGQQTAESESEFCEESSQDVCETDSNSSIQSRSDSNAGDEGRSWKRDEDKVILETFQKENDKETAFVLIANILKYRTVSQIRDRFETLMSILMRTIGND